MTANFDDEGVEIREGYKVCGRCRKVKPFWEFKWVGDDTSTGYGIFCIDCRPRQTRVVLYTRMFKQQKGVCAICGYQGKHGKLVIDHDHKTAKVRGLLCSGCNLVLGHVEDSRSWLGKMIEYLDKHGAEDVPVRPHRVPEGEIADVWNTPPWANGGSGGSRGA